MFLLSAPPRGLWWIPRLTEVWKGRINHLHQAETFVFSPCKYQKHADSHMMHNEGHGVHHLQGKYGKKHYISLYRWLFKYFTKATILQTSTKCWNLPAEPFKTLIVLQADTVRNKFAPHEWFAEAFSERCNSLYVKPSIKSEIWGQSAPVVTMKQAERSMWKTRKHLQEHKEHQRLLCF